MQTRDVIVVGASMGGLEALTQLVGSLPADLPASVLVVQHVSPDAPGVLGNLLRRRSALDVVTAEDGMPMERGRVYVAPPNRHLLAMSSCLRVVFGPRENSSRPAVDPLFRTAAVHLQSRVIGVILTGLRADGASGLRAVVRCGGAAVVQAPDDAEYPEMPRHAMERVPLAHVAPLAGMGDLLSTLSREAAPPAPEVPNAFRIEVRLTERAMKTGDWNAVPGSPTRLTCPECDGPLQAIDDGGDVRYRCQVGHAYSTEDLLAENGEAVENALWVGLQTVEERAEMLETMARADRARGWAKGAEGFDLRARELRAHAGRLRALLVSLSG